MNECSCKISIVELSISVDFSFYIFLIQLRVFCNGQLIWLWMPNGFTNLCIFLKLHTVNINFTLKLSKVCSFFLFLQWTLRNQYVMLKILLNSYRFIFIVIFLLYPEWEKMKKKKTQQQQHINRNEIDSISFECESNWVLIICFEKNLFLNNNIII